MGLFSRSPKLRTDDVPTVLYHLASEALKQRLRDAGSDLDSNALLRNRAGKFVTPSINALEVKQKEEIAKHPERLTALADTIATDAVPKFLEELAGKPIPEPGASGADRYGPNWQAIASLFTNIRAMSAADWEHVIAGLRAMSAPSRHPAQQRMRELVGWAAYKSGEAIRRLGLEDQGAFADLDARDLAGELMQNSQFVLGSLNTGTQPDDAIGPVTRAIESAAQALMVGSDQLEPQYFAALSASFVKQIVGADQYARAQNELGQEPSG